MGQTRVYTQYSKVIDRLSKKDRSAIMSRIRSRDTKPEKIVRSLLHQMGYRFRIHEQQLPGSPDIVLRPRKKVIFVNGCFWHQHSAKSCKLSKVPKSNLGYWLPKLKRNRARDRKVHRELRLAGWQIMTVWECQTENLPALERRLTKFLGA